MRGSIVKFSQFMASGSGRVIRVIAGIVIFLLGAQMHSGAGYVIAVIGIVPMAAGIFDFCLIAPLVKMPFAGKAIRAFKK